MELVIILAIVVSYYGLSEKIQKILKRTYMNKKDFPSFKDLINKQIEIELIDGCVKDGTLIKYDNVWIALENKDKNGVIKQNYFRISNISSINILDK